MDKVLLLHTFQNDLNAFNFIENGDYD